jgi:predicted O-methyltransferase YrrM
MENKILRRYKLIISQNSHRFELLYHFTKFLFQFYLYEKIKVKSEEKKFNNSIVNKKFQVNWFSFNCYYWLKYLKGLNGRALEIGSFEGVSTMFILKKLCFNYLECVDPWTGNEEMYDVNHKDKDLNPNLSEKNFDLNMQEFSGLYKKNKMFSDKFFNINNNSFNFIFIDGSHEYQVIRNDIKNSFNNLNKNGIIIIDDIFFNYYKDFKKNILFAIVEFFGTIKNFKILSINYRQLILKKI